MNQSLGLIEVAGLLPAIAVADAMAKAANIQIKGIEKARGNGWTTVKIEGAVDAVKAAIDSGEVVAQTLNSFVASKVIARPDQTIFKTFVPTPTEEIEPVKEEVEPTKEEKPVKEVKKAKPKPAKEEKPAPPQPLKEEVVEEVVEEKVEEIETAPEPVEEALPVEILDREAEMEAVAELKEQEKVVEKEATCNLCLDPACSRVKGDLRADCIHYKK